MRTIGDIAGGIGFGVLTFFLHAAALLPLGCLYVISDVLAFFAYHVIRYRRKVVRGNLTSCFPEKSMDEIKKIEKQFYRNFTDYIVETIKLLHISDSEISRRMVFEGLDIIDAMLDRNKTIVAYFSHTGNWEWAPSIKLHSRHGSDNRVEFCQIYRPLRNVRFDRLMLKIRSRFGSTSIPKARTLRELLALKKAGRPSITGFMSDQKPSHGDHTHVLDYFGRPTAVITGTEALAHRLGTAVVYWDMVKTSRGHYTIRIRRLTDDASEITPWALTAEYFKELGDTIRRDPAIWLWTHRRWANSPSTWADVDPQTLIEK